MLKWFKFLVGLLLLPVCAGAVTAFLRVLAHSGNGDDAINTWVGIGGGAAAWTVVYLMMPKPMLIYVFGHELTHVLWTWLFGGKVKQFKASANGGHVIVTKNNFLISLAPYFFPLYAFMVITVFIIGHLIWNWLPYLMWFHLALGASYAFHLTLTWHILKTEQSDITQHGYLFSAVIIFLGNTLILMLAVPLLGKTLGVFTPFQWWWSDTWVAFQKIVEWARVLSRSYK